MKVLLFLFGIYTLAPAPINFTREVVNVDGEDYIVEFINNKLTIRQEDWQEKLERRVLLRDIHNGYKPPNDIDFNIPENGCLYLLFLAGFGWAILFSVFYRLFFY